MGRPAREKKETKVARRLARFPPELREAVERFFSERGLTNPHSRDVYTLALERLAGEGIDPLGATEGDLRRFRDTLASSLSGATVDTYLTRLKAFYSWLRPGDNPLAWWKSSPRARRRNLRDEVLSPEEVEALVRAARSPRAKAAIAVLYEGALRVGELCSLRMRDLERTGYGYKIRVSGKTGERTVPLVNSAPYLREWLLVHPDPGNPDAPLFARVGRGGRVEGMSEGGVAAVVRYAARKAGLGRRVHPHTLRHTRLTHLATRLTEQELKVFAGWTPDSKMASVYVHLSGRDAERAILKAYGMEVPEREDRRRVEALKPLTCPECGYVNPREAEFCLRCGYPLTERARREAAREKREFEEMILRLLSDPRVREPLIRALAEVLREKGQNGRE